MTNFNSFPNIQTQICNKTSLQNLIKYVLNKNNKYTILIIFHNNKNNTSKF